MSVRAVLFDLDNTLYPYAPCHEAGKRAAWHRAEELGFSFDRDGFEEFYRAGRREVKREIGGTAASHERYLYFKRAFELETGVPKPSEAYRLGEAYWDAYVAEMELFDGVIETFEALSEAGIEIGIVTNLTTHVQLQKLDALGIEDYLDVLVTSEESGREKNASDMFALALTRLDRRPSEVMMVGDDAEADVEGANAVGLTTVLFNADETELRSRRTPDHRLEHMSDLQELVR